MSTHPSLHHTACVPHVHGKVTCVGQDALTHVHSRIGCFASLLGFLCCHRKLARQPIMGQQLLAGFFLQEPWWRRDVQRRVGHRGLGCTPQLATPPHLPLAGAATTSLPTTAVGVRAATTSSAYSATVPAARSIVGFQSGFRHGFNVG